MAKKPALEEDSRAARQLLLQQRQAPLQATPPKLMWLIAELPKRPWKSAMLPVQFPCFVFHRSKQPFQPRQEFDMAMKELAQSIKELD
ncbi:MAG: hypothetical protein IPP69_15145 [Flavobacteriales bacterium]|nr:hypothetical protein [Flavobacteriales bacterium]